MLEEGAFDWCLMWVDKPLAHYQIVDLEDIVGLLMCRIVTVSKRSNSLTLAV